MEYTPRTEIALPAPTAANCKDKDLFWLLPSGGAKTWVDAGNSQGFNSAAKSGEPGFNDVGHRVYPAGYYIFDTAPGFPSGSYGGQARIGQWRQNTTMADAIYGKITGMQIMGGAITADLLAANIALVNQSIQSGSYSPGEEVDLLSSTNIYGEHCLPDLKHRSMAQDAGSYYHLYYQQSNNGFAGYAPDKFRLMLPQDWTDAGNTQGLGANVLFCAGGYIWIPNAWIRPENFRLFESRPEKPRPGDRLIERAFGQAQRYMPVGDGFIWTDMCAVSAYELASLPSPAGSTLLQECYLLRDWEDKNNVQGRNPKDKNGNVAGTRVYPRGPYIFFKARGAGAGQWEKIDEPFGRYTPATGWKIAGEPYDVGLADASTAFAKALAEFGGNVIINGRRASTIATTDDVKSTLRTEGNRYDTLKDLKGYCMLPGGFIMQWILAKGETTGQNFSKTWLTPFPNECLAVTITTECQLQMDTIQSWYVLMSRDTNGCSYYIRRAGTGPAMRANIIAFGY